MIIRTRSDKVDMTAEQLAQQSVLEAVYLGCEIHGISVWISGLLELNPIAEYDVLLSGRAIRRWRFMRDGSVLYHGAYLPIYPLLDGELEFVAEHRQEVECSKQLLEQLWASNEVQYLTRAALDVFKRKLSTARRRVRKYGGTIDIDAMIADLTVDQEKLK